MKDINYKGISLMQIQKLKVELICKSCRNADLRNIFTLYDQYNDVLTNDIPCNYCYDLNSILCKQELLHKKNPYILKIKTINWNILNICLVDIKIQCSKCDTQKTIENYICG